MEETNALNIKFIQSCIDDEKNYTEEYITDIRERFTNIDIDFLIANKPVNLIDPSIIYCLVEKFGSNPRLLSWSIKIASALIKERDEIADEPNARRGVGHHMVTLPLEPLNEFVPSSIIQRPSSSDVKSNKFSGNKFGYTNRCYILYDIKGNDTVNISIFYCDVKGEGRKLMNDFLHYVLNINPNIRLINLRSSPLIKRSHAPRERIVEAQTKLNQYYRDIGFQKMDTDNHFSGDINDVLHYTENYVKGSRGGRRKTRRKTRRIKKCSRKGSRRR